MIGNYLKKILFLILMIVIIICLYDKNEHFGEGGVLVAATGIGAINKDAGDTIKNTQQQVYNAVNQQVVDKTINSTIGLIDPSAATSIINAKDTVHSTISTGTATVVNLLTTVPGQIAPTVGKAVNNFFTNDVSNFFKNNIGSAFGYESKTVINPNATSIDYQNSVDAINCLLSKNKNIDKFKGVYSCATVADSITTNCFKNKNQYATVGNGGLTCATINNILSKNICYFKDASDNVHLDYNPVTDETICKEQCVNKPNFKSIIFGNATAGTEYSCSNMNNYYLSETMQCSNPANNNKKFTPFNWPNNCININNTIKNGANACLQNKNYNFNYGGISMNIPCSDSSSKKDFLTTVHECKNNKLLPKSNWYINNIYTNTNGNIPYNLNNLEIELNCQNIK